MEGELALLSRRAPVTGAASKPAGQGLLSRRAALRSGATAAGVAAVGAALAACGPGGASQTAASPTKAAAILYNIVWRPWYNFNQATSKTGHALLMQGIQPWLDKNPGVAVTITYMGYQATTVAAILAGTGPDVFADWVLPLYTGSNLLLDLSKYVRQNNVDLSIFPRRDMEVFQQGGGLWALPSYLHLQAPAVNLGVLDQLGVTYPQPGWTYQQWTDLMKSVTHKSTTAKDRRQGGWFYWSGYDYWGNDPHAYYLAGFGGEYVDPSDNSKSYLDSPGTQACLSWIYELLVEGVCGTGGLDFRSGQQVVNWMDTAGGLIGAAQTYGGVKWQMYDEFVWPKGKISYAASDFYAINAGTKNPDLCWDFLDYLCVKQDWQKWMVNLALNGPNQKALYPFWETTVKQVAPPLAKIDLNVFTRQMQDDDPYFGLTFKYADQQAGVAIGNATKPAVTNPQIVPQVCKQGADQINALELAAATESLAQNATAKQFPTGNGTVIAAVQPGM